MTGKFRRSLKNQKLLLKDEWRFVGFCPHIGSHVKQTKKIVKIFKLKKAKIQSSTFVSGQWEENSGEVWKNANGI